MAKKNKKANSIDVSETKPIASEEKNESVKVKATIDGKEPFYKGMRIPIYSSIVKIKNKYYLEDKKSFYLLFSLIIFALLVSITLFVCGILWATGAFGGINSDEMIWAGLLMAFSICILILV
ncbi:MAG: hypothetical protein ACRCVI_01260 [Mycoplasmoidaceae bacterium]